MDSWDEHQKRQQWPLIFLPPRIDERSHSFQRLRDGGRSLLIAPQKIRNAAKIVKERLRVVNYKAARIR